MLSTDGVNPWQGSLYSMWPVVFKVLNLPPHLASITDLLLLCAVIHGPHSPADFTPYFRVIIDELMDGWEGIVTTHPVTRETATVRTILAIHGGDYPALCKLNKCQGATSKNGCLFCFIHGGGIPGLAKKVCFGQYRRYLPRGHQWRSASTRFPSAENRPPPRRKDTPTIAYLGHQSLISEEVKWGVVGISQLLHLTYDGLPYDLLYGTAADAMHAIKGIGRYFILTMKGERKLNTTIVEPSAPEPTQLAENASVKQRAAHKVRWEKQVDKYAAKLLEWRDRKIKFEQIKKTTKAWRMTLAQRSQSDQRWNSLRGLPGFVRATCMPFQRTGSMKMHDWIVFLDTDVGKFCLVGLLPDRQYQIVCQIMDIVKHILVKAVDVVQLTEFYTTMVESMCEFEETMPVTNHLMVFHLLLELYHCVLRLGPSFYYWMFMFERFLSTLTRKIHDRYRPESNMVQNQADDVATANVNFMYGGKLKDSFQGDLGGRIYKKYIQQATFLRSTKPTPLVQFPACVQRPPYVYRASLTFAEHSQLGDTLQTGTGSYSGGQVDQKYWCITSKILINGVVRSTMADHARRRHRGYGTTASFRVDDGTMAEIVCFMRGTYTRLSRFGSHIHAIYEVAQLHVYPVYYDLGSQLYYVKYSERQVVFMQVEGINQSKVILAPLYTDTDDCRYIIDAETGLRPR